jgi:gliding motility-associated-like protein
MRFTALLLAIIAYSFSFAQLDVKHYIPAFFARENVEQHFLILSTPSNGAVNFTVSRGNGALITTGVISAATPLTFNLGTGFGAIGIINVNELNTANAADGLIIEASAPIYANIRHKQGAQGLSLTSKGEETAKGTKFRSGHVRSNGQQQHRKAHWISVMATEDNTTVTFDDFKNGVRFWNTPFAAFTSNPITTTINAGESYVIAALQNDVNSTNNINDVNGSAVSSDKPIIVNCGSWLAGAQGWGRDIGCDQLVPESRLGTEFIFLEGNGNANTERPLVVAAYANTDVYVNGNPVPVANLANAGDYIYLPQSSYSANDNIYIQTSQDVYMYQSLSGANTAGTGLNFIPPLRCNGFKEVVIPDVELVGAATISITARANANVYVNGNPAPIGGGLTVPGNPYWLTYKVPGGIGDFTVTSDSIINVALLNVQGVRGAAGYFTGFAQFVETDRGDTTSFVICNDSTSSFVQYSLSGPYYNIEHNFYSPNPNGTFTVDGFSNDTLFFTYYRTPGATGSDTLDLRVCKLLECGGGLPDSVCEVSTLIFNSYGVINIGFGDSTEQCVDDPSTIDLNTLLTGADPGGYWLDLDTSGALFGSIFNPQLTTPGNYDFAYVILGQSICIDSTVVNVEVNPMNTAICCAIDPTLTLTHVSCFGGNNGNVGIADQYATAFSIDGTNFQASPSFSNLTAGNYTLISTYGPDCSDTLNFIITEPDSLIISITTDSTECFSDCNGQLQVSTAGGTSPFSFINNASVPQTDSLFTGLCTGNYTLQVTDSNGCQASLLDSILEPEVITIVLDSIENEACNSSNGAIYVSGTGGTISYNYELVELSITQNNGNFTGLDSGQYTMVISDQNGCTDTIQVSLDNVDGPDPFLSASSNILCFGLNDGTVLVGVNNGVAPFTYDLDGVNSQSSNYFPSVGAGAHYVEVMDANGCTDTIQFTLTTPTELQIASSFTDVLCYDECNAEVYVDVTGGTAPYQSSSNLINFGLDFNQFDTLYNICEGVIQVTVKDQNGCQKTVGLNITQPDSLYATYNVTEASCFGVCDGALQINSVGGTSPFQYSIDNGATFVGTSNFTPLCADEYDIVLIDDNGCLFNEEVDVTEPLEFQINLLDTFQTTCGDANGGFEIDITGGQAGPYDISLDPTAQFVPGVTAHTFNSLGAGVYLVQAEDQTGCIDTLYVGVSDNNLTLDINAASIIDVDCFGECTGQIILEGTGGQGPYTYALNIGAYSTDSVFSSLCANWYTVAVQDNNGCIATDQVEVQEPDELEMDLFTTDLICNSVCDGVIHFDSLFGGIAPYEFSIDDINYTSVDSIPNLCAGTYTGYLRDDSACVIQQNFVIYEPDTLDPIINTFPISCFGDNTGGIAIQSFGGTLPYEFSFDGGGSFSATSLIGSLIANNYDIVIQDGNGCTYSETITISEPPLLGATVAITNLLCNSDNTGQIIINETGGSPSYLFSINGGANQSNSNSFPNLAEGSYDVYVQDSLNCQWDSTVVITEPPVLGFSATTVSSNCSPPTGEIDLTGSGGTGAFTFTIDSVNFQANGLFQNLDAGTYPAEIIDQNNCVYIENITIDYTPNPVISNVSFNNPTCKDSCNGDVTLTIIGGSSPYEFSTDGVNYGPSNTLNGMCAGTMTIFVRDANNCSTQIDVNFTEPDQILPTSLVTDLICHNIPQGEIEVSASGGTGAFLISIDSGITYSVSNTFNSLDEGTYYIFAQDINGCIGSSSTVINEPDSMYFDAFDLSSIPTCQGDCDGTISVSVQGGTIATDYTYAWTNSLADSTSNTATAVCAGINSLYVYDDNNCLLDSIDFEMVDPALVMIDSNLIVNQSCDYNCDGEVNIYSSTAATFSINASPPQAGNNFTALCQGSYWFYIYDNNGCLGDSTELYVNSPQPLQIFIEPGLNICSGDQVFMNATITGGTQGYTVNWNNTGVDLIEFYNNPTQDTTYFATVIDTNGCTASSDTSEILLAPPLTLTMYGHDTLCFNDLHQVGVNTNEYFQDYTYLWNTGDTIAYIDFNIQSDTMFTVTVTDECGDVATDSVSILLHINPVVPFTASDTIGCEPLNTSVFNSFPNSQIGSDCYWDLPDGGTILSQNCDSMNAVFDIAGCYDVSLSFTTINGCPFDTTYSNPICVNPNPIPGIILIPDPPSVYDYEVTLENGSTGGNTYLWIIGGTDSITTEDVTVPIDLFPIDSSVSVCLYVTSVDGCTAEICDTVLIEDKLDIYVPNAFIPDGNGRNDIFMPYLNNINVDLYEFMIFNRWGELVFTTKNLNEGWDGTYKGMNSPDGVYVWKIEYAIKGEVIIKEMYGHVTLLR